MKAHFIWRYCDSVFSFGPCGLPQCSADSGADTSKKQALYHIPGWLTLTEQVQTPYHARVLKTPVNRQWALHNRRFRKRWRRPQILHFCGDDRRIRSMHVLIRPRLLPFTSIVPAKLQDLRPSPSFTKSSIKG